MKYKDYYHGSYDRLPTRVQEGLAAQYGIDDWPTVSRLWDQERGVEYTPRPVQSQTNTPSFNRSTYEKGTYTLPSPASRAFTRLGQGISDFAGNVGQGISNAYSNFSEGLESWEKRNPNWKDAVANMANASLEAKYQGRDGWVAGTKAFADTLDPTSQYNVERQRRIDEMDPGGAAHRKLVRETALALGISEQEAEGIIKRRAQQTNQEKELTLQKSIDELSQTPEDKVKQKIKEKIWEYMALHGGTEEEARKALALQATRKFNADLAKTIAETRFRDARTDLTLARSGLTVAQTREAEEALANRDLDLLYKADPSLGAAYQIARSRHLAMYPNDKEGAEAAGRAAVQPILDQQKRKRETELRRLRAEADEIERKVDQMDLDKEEARRKLDRGAISELSQELQDYYNIHFDYANTKGDVKDPHEYALEKLVEKLKLNDDEQRAGIANTESSTKLNDANIDKIANDIVNGTGGKTSTDRNTWKAEFDAGNTDLNFDDWKLNKSLTENTSKLGVLINEKMTGLDTDIRDGKEITLDNGKVLTNEQAQALTYKEKFAEAVRRANKQEIANKLEVEAGKGDIKIRDQQYEDAAKEKKSANDTKEAADRALAILKDMDPNRFGALAPVTNWVFSAISQLFNVGSPDQVSLVNQLEASSTEFALSAVQLTKGSISNAEMGLFQQMFVNPVNNKRANIVRMQIISHVSEMKKRINSKVMQWIDRNGKRIPEEEAMKIVDKVKAEMQKYTNSLDQMSQNILNSAGSSDGQSQGVSVYEKTLVDKLKEAVKNGDKAAAEQAGDGYLKAVGITPDTPEADAEMGRILGKHSELATEVLNLINN